MKRFADIHNPEEPLEWALLELDRQKTPEEAAALISRAAGG
jgi:hypothetical protein